MGEHFLLECAEQCGYMGAGLSVGEGFSAERDPRRCKQCGDFTDVLVARIERGERVPARGRGRCRSCGSQALTLVDDLGAVRCPNCGGPLRARPLAIWD